MHGVVLGGGMKGLSRIADNPSRHLQKIAAEIDSYDTRDKIDRILDELDFIHELVDPDMQPKVTEVTNALMERYRVLGG
jgi:hypothetical protein